MTADEDDEELEKMIVDKARETFKNMLPNGMELMGYVCTVRDGWVVNIYKDGRIEQLKKIG